MFKNLLTKIKKLLNTRKKKAIFLLLVLILGYAGWKVVGTTKTKPQYQTAQAEKGTLIISVSASGNITTGNNLNITTNATGIVNKIYVKNGDTITQGQKIAEITLDQDSQQKQAAAWSSYLSAKNTLQASQDKINSLQSALFVANQKFVTDRGIANPSDQQKADPVYIEENASWLQAEADYKNQTGIISQAQSAVNNAWLSYQRTSSTITAPISGIISNLTINEGSPIVSQSSSSSTNTVTLQNLGTITAPDAHTQAIVNLSEIDSPKVKVNQKATLTLDAFPDKTFTGKIVTIDTNGQVSSNVNTYPATIVFDTSDNHIYPNMSVTAKIITMVKNDVILVPLGAVQTTSGQFTVRILKNGQVTSVSVETGNANETQTEIVSGVNEGETVVTNVVSSTTQSSRTTSPFSNFGGGNARFSR